MKFERVAVIGEREIALGFELVGIKDTFIKSGAEAVSKLSELMESKTYNLILVSEGIKAHMDKSMIRIADSSLTPLVVFIPMSGAEAQQESLEGLAKRVLGVDIKRLSK